MDTISEFLLQAGTDYRIFDMARGIRQLSSQDFLEIENAVAQTPYPRQQHTWVGILFFNRQMSNEHYIWFVKLPLDEQGLVIAAARKQFLQIVVEALGQSLDKHDNQNNQLPENPFTFVPNQQQLADFNSICRMALKLPLSEHLSFTEKYLTSPKKIDWKTISLQGIADFTASLQHEKPKALLLKQFFKLAPDMQHAVCASLENHPVDEDISLMLIDWYQQNTQDELRLNSVLRGLCQSQTESKVKLFVSSILDSEHGQQSIVLMLIAARHWRCLNDTNILNVYIEKLANCQQGSFIGLFPDLVQIPNIRANMLEVLRWPDKSPQLTQAIGQLFGQNKL
jgi:hypothetical protein